MDYLPFIDYKIPSDEYKNEAERLIREAMQKQDITHLHPYAQKSVKMGKIANHVIPDSIFQEYIQKHTAGDKPKGQKRSLESIYLNDENFLQEFNSKHPHVDPSRYSLEDISTEDNETSIKNKLAVIDSYLAHQIITLRDLIPQTSVNQWAINNDFMRTSTQIIDNLVSQQKKQLEDLDKYREKAQINQVASYDKLNYDINERILDIIEDQFPK
ncbi:similar to Saccharomyces cerevisiae YPR101W SNT309 Member of the NineTeen Complex (NTC) that contains Prp19p and stabilizes U6 snRNA in catalytic forms of the spliceosome containing U2 [Maudiozyma barnettii]|uniref:Similar to Saccharomyces cerevisiae YPR101W SNT309 Member of the NineTeen Complex (NTC) that contains Prp19p and stabilizes U6 snRNA in catalytic forms of the spliceosome containing U2 n=1 Tax=Maudiozyma barnettii TaxID=61262 RepID=A0A8H2VB96_9SACH|nr:Snt309p [Kazachstania barnettii]CAB4252072.1 similar to Saccharomyces cerevisiae YPR101W SNT309 Member of the NineTeen Complex (NTC) that contains Prp19p and stabilizes U6 snRNA in catalytic forms of the spliceosome containing U2 [Kazachstania barnettii]CAD1778561.1 similar to Saccharomyces cerevisiae YPR101W SNT309 Member of the NineTeen Complex (NTC) that contains Prp19p and stabilizes U6 snRNA in catalytic forms of the spliceosome containing U2 [Kazachstania barnettii]